MEDETEEATQMDLKAAVAEGLAQSLRGESAPIDFAELKRELRARLNRSG
ncbi:MAG: hypothetical protein KF889_03470 [Alphaproteobacteria bacterium]|nr:hypothetical protein [Alphaproteobacteria bacterium]MCW5741969.1 hypothetical protein [Alphaproteobacteria bacterium]